MTNRNQLGAFGYYMIGYFDVLGQSNKLLDLPTNPEPKDVVEHLRQTAAAVLTRIMHQGPDPGRDTRASVW